MFTKSLRSIIESLLLKESADQPQPHDPRENENEREPRENLEKGRKNHRGTYIAKRKGECGHLNQEKETPTTAGGGEG